MVLLKTSVKIQTLEGLLRQIIKRLGHLAQDTLDMGRRRQYICEVIGHRRKQSGPGIITTLTRTTL